MTTTNRPGMGLAKVLALVAVVGAAAGAAGAFGWTAFSSWRTEREAAEAARQAEAERRSPMGQQREFVKSRLNDPESAMFRNVKPAARGARMWCGEVNARNRMGGMVGFSRYVAQTPDPDRPWDQGDLVIEDSRSNAAAAERAAFAGRWSVFCE